MNELLQRYLDGEIPLEDLSPVLRAEARRWDERLEAVRAQGPRGMPAGLETRVMRAVEREAATRGWRGAWTWLVRPRTVAVSPLTAAVGAAALAILMVAPWRDAPPPASPDGAPAAVGVVDRAPDVIVEFVLEAPSARSVAVAGDFTTWSPAVELQDPDGDGVWSGRARIQPGVHKYMFVLDGSEWVTDPRAARHVDDGFGNRNAVMVVPGGSRS